MKRIPTGLALLLALMFQSGQAFSHPGKLDAQGGHYCRENCEQYGLKDGEYHYHKTPAETVESAKSPVEPAKVSVEPAKSPVEPASKALGPVPVSVWVLLGVVVGVPVLLAWGFWHSIKKFVVWVKRRGHNL